MENEVNDESHSPLDQDEKFLEDYGNLSLDWLTNFLNSISTWMC
ncbi:MAG TPA: hypothetical protein VJ697_08080 [Nitrososphaeraceae archaeon]|nr:hypothetical protein [Nitrososphaeraceae archaeon]